MFASRTLLLALSVACSPAEPEPTAPSTAESPRKPPTDSPTDPPPQSLLPAHPQDKTSTTPPLPASPTAELPPPLPRDREFRRGISLGLFVSTHDETYRAELYRQFLDEIAAVGATDVQLVVQWSQRSVRATEIAPASGVSVDDELLAWVIQRAHARRLRVFLMPILHLAERPLGQWRGKLDPGDWDRWWRSYDRFILHYAKLARRQRVELFSVGSELISTERQTERWRALIASVRRRFGGQLTYSANWDHFEPIGFWEQLDVAGITGYQALSKQDDPEEEALVRGFAGLKARVARWAAERDLRFVFTEIGYPSQPGGARRPWDYRERGVADPALQLRCYRALYRAWQADPRLGGLYAWNWFGRGGVDDRGYTPRGKPAEAVLRRWYRDSRPPQPAASPGTAEPRR